MTSKNLKGKKKTNIARCYICDNKIKLSEPPSSDCDYFCDECIAMLNDEDEDNVTEYLPLYNEISVNMLDLTFKEYWDELKGLEVKYDSDEELAQMSFAQGVNSILVLLVASGMPLQNLIDMRDNIKEMNKMKNNTDKEEEN